MTAQEIKDRIAQCATLFAFDYKGKSGDVDPFDQNNFSLFYDGESLDVSSIDEVMTTPFYAGKALGEIAEDISITEW